MRNGWDKAYKKPLEKDFIFMRWKELYLHSAQPNDPVAFDENLPQDDYDRPDLASQLYIPTFR